MLSKVYIRHREQHPENENLFSALEGFEQCGVETVPFFGFGDIEELTDLSSEVGLCGYVGDVQSALLRMGAAVPEPIDYPADLAPWLGRGIERATLGMVRGSTQSRFVKPVAHKLFTGFVWDGSAESRRRVVTIPSDQPVWVADVVDFVAEFRAFCKGREVLDVRRYRGRWDVAPDATTVNACLEAWKSPPAAFALDFGVTADGRTLLVEANDSFALGTYGLSSLVYVQMISARWEELAANRVLGSSAPTSPER